MYMYIYIYIYISMLSIFVLLKRQYSDFTHRFDVSKQRDASIFGMAELISCN